MNLIILDLEWNAAYSKKLKRYVNEIIEFGAVKCDQNLNIISTFSSFVKYQIGKKLSNVVTELTTIKDENLSGAKPFMNVASRFKKWAGNDSIILTWGTSDILALIDNFSYFNVDGKISFLNEYADLQKYCESLLSNDSSSQLGLNTAAEILSVDLSNMVHHRALDDSLLSLAVMKRLWPQNSLAPFIEDARNPEFYRKMTFKTSIISDITHPLITNKNLVFTCEKCSGTALRSSKWQFKNKRFIADFKCPNCGYEFSGRIQLKEKYEGIVVNKKAVSISKIQSPRKAVSALIGKMELHIENNNVGLLRFNSWKHIEGVNHSFSTRIGGVSKGIFASTNLGFGRGDSDDNVHKNFELICDAMNIEKSSLITGNQDHQCNIRKVTSADIGTGIETPKFEGSFDGLCTNEKGVTLVVYCADCVPLYFYDPVKKAIALSHAGWRGTVNGMAKETVIKMINEYGCNPDDIIVAIGPSISKDNFEVDLPCADEFIKLDDFEKFVEYKGNEKYLVNLWECNRKYLISAGVRNENITIGDVCSVKNSDLIFSHRVTKGQRGSNAAFLCLR